MNLIFILIIHISSKKIPKFRRQAGRSPTSPYPRGHPSTIAMGHHPPKVEPGSEDIYGRNPGYIRERGYARRWPSRGLEIHVKSSSHMRGEETTVIRSNFIYRRRSQGHHETAPRLATLMRPDVVARTVACSNYTWHKC